MGPMLATLLVVLVVLGAVAYGIGLALSKRAEPWREAVAARCRRLLGLQHVVPDGRPIEEIAADLRRLGTRFHGLHPHASYAKAEGVRCAYDRVLAECCEALGLAQLLGVLGPGSQLDAERSRVEGLLTDSGLSLSYPG